VCVNRFVVSPGGGGWGVRLSERGCTSHLEVHLPKKVILYLASLSEQSEFLSQILHAAGMALSL
jgi:hypothetical protein